MRRRTPRSTRTDTRFPYTTLFRSDLLSRIVEKSAHRRDDRAVELIEGWRGLGIVDRSAKLDDRPGRPAEVGGVPGLRATVRHHLRAGGQATGEVAQPSRPVFVSARYRQAERHLGIRLLPRSEEHTSEL